MSKQVLNQFLKKQLFDLDGTDEKLKKLVATSDQLSDILTQTPYKALSYILAALDPQVSESQPIVIETLGVLEENWPTYFNAFHDQPTQIVRALLLQALANKLESQQVSIAFVSLARNILPSIETGKEREIWVDLVQDMELNLNQQAEKEWSTPKNIATKDFSYTPLKVNKLALKKGEIDHVSLQRGIAKATGPTDKDGDNTSGNEYWPASNELWANEFTPLLTAAIAQTIEDAVINIDFSKPLKHLSNAVGSHIDIVLDAVSSATIGLQRRTDLIWWKESLYSPSALCSYREMSSNIAAIVMAFDIFKQVPTCSPASVTAFLYETVSSLPVDESTRSLKLIDLIAEVKGTDCTNSFCKYLDDLFTESEGKGLLLPLLRYSSRSSTPNQEGFNNLKGLESHTEKTNSEWASWIFRELQATRAILQEADANG